MKWLRFVRFLPFTFLAGQQGFLLFAPYLAFFCATVELLRLYQRRTERLALA